MEPMSPSNHSAEMQCVTPDCTSRYSIISASAEDSGYSSIPSSGISINRDASHLDTSVSPIYVRKRLFDSAVSTCTPDISYKDRASRRLSGRCLIPTIIVEEDEDKTGGPVIENQSVVHGFSTPTKSFLRKFTPSPKKHHPYVRDNAGGKISKHWNSTVNPKTRTPPRKGRSTSPITKFPSFAETSVYRDPCRPRYGAEYVDFLWCLGKERMMAPALSHVLSQLSGEDLMACSVVSKTWNTIVMNDKSANSRRLAAIEKRKVRKENLACAPPRDRGNCNREHRSVLGVIQKDSILPPVNPILKTPPPKMSPKRFRFELYMKEGLRVDGNESQHLKPCPHCSFPSLVDTKLNLGVCTRHGCQFRFCTLCHCLEHVAPINAQSSSPPRYIVCPFAPKASTPPSPPQPALLATKRQLDLVGSKRSKRNLRRL